jgi:acyl carrier protein
MTLARADAETLVLRIVQERAFDGEARPLPLDAGLVELGFDSFALVTVVSGLEEAVGSGFPMQFWEERGDLRLVDLVDAVQLFGRRIRPEDAWAGEPLRPPQPSRLSPLRSVAAAAVRQVYSTLDVVVIERELAGSLPRFAPPPAVSLRRATPADLGAFRRLWPPVIRTRRLRQVRAWLRDGYVCLAAFEQDEVVAVDWLNDADPVGGVAAGPGTCLGIDLFERHDQTGRGVGLALLSRSLEVAREEG